MELNTSRFGRIQCDMGKTLCFPAGLIGLEDCRSWVLLSEGQGHRVIWLQSTQQPEIALPLIDPRTFVSDFTLQIEQTDWAPLGHSASRARCVRTMRAWYYVRVVTCGARSVW